MNANVNVDTFSLARILPFFYSLAPRVCQLLCSWFALWLAVFSSFLSLISVDENRHAGVKDEVNLGQVACGPGKKCCLCSCVTCVLVADKTSDPICPSIYLEGYSFILLLTPVLGNLPNLPIV